MNLNQIKLAIAQGKRVFWKNKGYEVLKSKGRQTGKDMYLVVWNKGGYNENAIGLTWQDEVTMNGKPEDFFTD